MCVDIMTRAPMVSSWYYHSILEHYKMSLSQNKYTLLLNEVIMLKKLWKREKLVKGVVKKNGNCYATRTFLLLHVGQDHEMNTVNVSLKIAMTYR